MKTEIVTKDDLPPDGRPINFTPKWIPIIKSLRPGEILKVTLDATEKPASAYYGLRGAASRLNKRVVVKRRGHILWAYLTPDMEK